MVGVLALCNEANTAPRGDQILFSEYVGGTSNDKAIEIYNAGSQAVDLMGCVVRIFANGSDVSGSMINLSGIVQSGVVCACEDSGGRCGDPDG